MRSVSYTHLDVYKRQPMSYIADIEDAEQFDPLFMDALATRLAEKLAKMCIRDRD